jgi:GT2 family glycosyltransferase
MQPIASFSLGNINPGNVRSEFMDSWDIAREHERQLQRTTDSPRIQLDQTYKHVHGPYLDDARNDVVNWFLNHTTSDYLVFQDSDVATYRPETYWELVQTAHEQDIKLLGGVYFNDYGGLGPVIYRWVESEDRTDLLPISLEEMTKYAEAYPGEPMQVDSMGAGFMCIHRDLLTTIGGTWETPGTLVDYFNEPTFRGVHYGEDHGFCLRACHVGHPPHVLPHMRVDHFKICILRGG